MSGRSFDFSPGSATGPQILFNSEDVSEKVVFELFFTEELFSFLVEMTNTCAAKKQTDCVNKKLNWVDTDTNEMRVFVGLLIAMGTVKQPNYKRYWNFTETITRTDGFSEIMSRDRFLAILSSLRFHDVTEPGPDQSDSRRKTYKIVKLINMVCSRFESVYVPDRELTIDEMMVKCKARIKIKQRMPAKLIKTGLKLWTVCEAKTGYVNKTRLYAGKEEEIDDVHGLQGRISADTKTARVVKYMVNHLKNQGYHLYMDNFYTSPALLYELHKDFRIQSCGTVRVNSIGYPEELKSLKPKDLGERGTSRTLVSGKLLAMAWKDKKVVHFLSTIHQPGGMLSVVEAIKMEIRWRLLAPNL